METIGQRIRRLRLDRGFKRQDALGQLVDIKQATMSSIEAHNQEFSGTDLMNLARVLQVSPEYIIYGGEEDDMGEIEIMQIYKSLSAPQREMLLQMARGLRPDKQNKQAA